MAVSTLPNPNIMPSYDTTNPGTGMSAATCIQCHQIRFGKMVFLSARIQITSAVSDAMSKPLLTLNRNVPNYSKTATDVPIPSIVRVNDAVFADLVSIKHFSTDNTWYAMQRVTSNLSANTTVEMFMAYESV